jgi:hypothetical protein
MKSKFLHKSQTIKNSFLNDDIALFKLIIKNNKALLSTPIYLEKNRTRSSHFSISQK